MKERLSDRLTRRISAGEVEAIRKELGKQFADTLPSQKDLQRLKVSRQELLDELRDAKPPVGFETI